MTSRTFCQSDQAAFAVVSGDSNPIHVDELAARRLMFGRTVVHGVHALLWALDSWCRTRNAPLTLSELRVDFQRPLIVGDLVRFELHREEQDKTELLLHARGKIAVKVRLRWSPRHLSTTTPEIRGSVPPSASPVDRSEPCLEGLSGHLSLYLPERECRSLFPHALRLLPGEQIAVLLASTRMVGMECPGLNSLYSQLSLQFTDLKPNGAGSTTLNYRVDSIDSRFHLALIRVEAPGAEGSVRAFVRPVPRAQIGFEDARSMVVAADAFRGRRTWVVGGSRGLGEVAAKLLAAGGAAVTITYHRGVDDADRIASEIRRGGGLVEIRSLNVLDLPDRFDFGEPAHRAPTDMLYFATPFITPGECGAFSEELFNHFCRYYVFGFSRLVSALAPHGLARVLYPSSVYVEDVPENLAEYGAAKAAGEAVCAALEKCCRGVRITRPRLPRMATDQTASLITLESEDPTPWILDALRL